MSKSDDGVLSAYRRETLVGRGFIIVLVLVVVLVLDLNA
jgi:hypothetical protein